MHACVTVSDLLSKDAISLSALTKGTLPVVEKIMIWCPKTCLLVLEQVWTPAAAVFPSQKMKTIKAPWNNKKQAKKNY